MESISSLSPELGPDRLAAELSSRFIHLAPDDVDDAISATMSLIGRAMGVDRVSMFRCSEGDDTFRVTNLWEAEGIRRDDFIPGILVRDHFPWLAETLFERNEAIMINELDEVPLPAAAHELEYCRAMGIQSFLMLPTVVANAPTCALVLDSMRSARRWDETVVERLRLLGEVVANAIARQRAELSIRRAYGEIEALKDRLEVENELLKSRDLQLARLTGELMRTQEDERRRIARDLHDGVNQRLVAAVIALQELGNEVPEEKRPNVAAIENAVTETSEEVRRVSHRLHPSLLEQLGLSRALERQCKEIERHGGPAIELSLPPIREAIETETATCLYRSAQEALQNVIKHSAATSVRVHLTRSDDGFGLSVTDDGEGFDTELIAEHRGLGLIGMEERVRLLNGRFEVRSTPGQGTSVDVWLPEAIERSSD